MPTPFQQQVYALCARVPKGRVTTYKEIGNALIQNRNKNNKIIATRNARAGFIYRAVGSALNKNPFAPKVPCHRVVANDGSLGGFAFGIKKKFALLNKEGITIKKNTIVEFEKRMWVFTDNHE